MSVKSLKKKELKLNNKPKVVAIIQARMSSTRLPGKVLLPLAGKPVLWWIAKRALLAEFVDVAVIATTWDSKNDPINGFCNYEGVFDDIDKGCVLYRYTGKENDVIGRVIAAANFRRADIVVDITADCPAIDPKHIDKLIKKLKMLKDQNLDYVSNDVVSRSWPDGLDIQVYWTDALIKCKRLFNPQQHCGWNIAQHPEVFNIHHWRARPSMRWPELGLTLDTLEDYEMLKVLFDKFGKDDSGFSAETVIKFLKKNREYITNADVRRKTPEEG